MPDPKLKEAAEEIKAILRKHDLAALITLQSPDAMEFVRELSPTWSCATIRNTLHGPMIHLKSKLADYPSKEAQQTHIEKTVGMFMGFHHQAMQDANTMAGVIKLVSRQLNISSIITEG